MNAGNGAARSMFRHDVYERVSTAMKYSLFCLAVPMLVACSEVGLPADDAGNPSDSRSADANLAETSVASDTERADNESVGDVIQGADHEAMSGDANATDVA